MSGMSPEKRAALKYSGAHVHLPLPDPFDQADVFTLLREPVDRILSSYYYSVEKGHLAVSEKEFFLHDDPLFTLSNQQTRLLSGMAEANGLSIGPHPARYWEITGWVEHCRLSQWPVTEEMFERAKASLERMFLVGVTDRFGAFVNELGRKLGVSNAVLSYSRRNASKHRKSDRDVPVEVLDRIRSLNDFDERLYAHAKSLTDAYDSTKTEFPKKDPKVELSRNRPFFTIVLPTRGRPEVVRTALENILHQTFDQFELFVIDNDVGGATRETVESFRDERVRYLRTGGLPMPDNWELAYKQGDGEYQILFRDRGVFLLPDALEQLKTICEQSRAHVITWRIAPQDPETGKHRIAGFSGKAQFMDSKAMVRSFLHGNYRLIADRSPRGLNCALQRGFLEKLRARCTTVCPTVSPDYTLAYQVLMETDRILHVDYPLVGQIREDLSNGRRSGLTEAGVEHGVKEWQVAESDLYKFTPAPFYTLRNSLFNDFFRLNEEHGWGFSFFDLDYTQYLALLMEDLAKFEMSEKNLQRINRWKVLYEVQSVHVKQSVSNLARQVLQEKMRSLFF